MKIALAQNNYVVGDLSGNARLIAQSAQQASQAGADLVVCSELALVGYPPRDLLLNRSFVTRSWEVVNQLANNIPIGTAVLVGIPEANDSIEGKPLYNSGVLLNAGGIQARFRKSLLPTYDVFDEDRYFEPAVGPQILRWNGMSLGITICEDIWNDRCFWRRPRYHTDPVDELARANVDAVINLSASPFTCGKQQFREAMVANMARNHCVPVCYVNQVGGNDDLVFDGRSFAIAATGHLVARARAFEEDLVVVDLENMRGNIALDDLESESEIWRALVVGTRDYVRKCHFSRVLLGLSGGIDSSLTAAIAVEAVGARNVLGILMPSPFSSVESVEDAQQLAESLGVRTITIPIASLMDAFDDSLSSEFCEYKRDVTEENIQARVRGTLLMALSNKTGALLLTTGNKSELAVGYCTLYGDMCGGLAVISDVPKTMVYRLSHWLNQRRNLIPPRVLSKAPSAELRPGQTDQDSLPPYHLLDAILTKHIEEYQSAQDLVSHGFGDTLTTNVLRMIKRAEFKRKQMPPGIKVTDRAFGTGWRMPIASHEDAVQEEETLVSEGSR
jgi:NAD+ synthase (glutamine-hydrolysing)